MGSAGNEIGRSTGRYSLVGAGDGMQYSFGSAVFFGFDLGMHAMWAVCQGAFAFFEKMVKNKVIPQKPR